MYNIITFWLKYYRNKCGLTQQDVSELLGFERSSYTYYESGKTTPDLETLIRLAKIFNVNILDLLAGCNPETGKYVTDAKLRQLAEETDEMDNARFEEARFEAEVLLRIRSLNNAKRDEVLLFLDDLTDNAYKNRCKAKPKQSISVKSVEIPQKELELLNRADISYLSKRSNNSSEKSAKLDDTDDIKD